MKLLIEIGTEELPASEILDLSKALADGVRNLLDGDGLVEVPTSLEAFSTPRRLAVLITGVRPKGSGTAEERRGPPLARAREVDGSWSRAALGFARSIGIPPEDLETRTTPDGTYLFGRIEREGRTVEAVLSGGLEKLVASLPSGRTMRWGDGAFRFVRPIRSFTALLDDRLVDVTLAGIPASRRVRLKRGEGETSLETAGDYAQSLRARGIEPDRSRRRESILAAVAAALEPGETPHLPEDLLEEIVDIVETPRVIRGTFDPSALEIPAPILEEAMVVQERQIPVRRDGALSPSFLLVANGGEDDVVRMGNEKVLGARLADAAFFYRQDVGRPLDEFVHGLDSITYLKDLGTLLDRARRLETLCPWIVAAAGVGGTKEDAARAGLLALFDRASQVVYEWPELEGTMGAIYAAKHGEPPSVCRAIEESVLPRAAERRMPESDIGWALATALRLDHLAGAFLAGLEPTGGTDPYAVRRAGLQFLSLLAGRKMGWGEAIERALALYGEGVGEEVRKAVASRIDGFLRARLEAQFVEAGHRVEVVQAVLRTALDGVDDIERRLSALETVMGESAFRSLALIHRRAAHLAAPGGEGAQGAAETELDVALRDTRESVTRALARSDDLAVFRKVASLEGPLEHFFAAVLVMDEDPAVRARRQGLLYRVIEITALLADLEVLPIEEEMP